MRRTGPPRVPAPYARQARSGLPAAPDRTPVACARGSTRLTSPVAVTGTASTNTTRRGRLNEGRPVTRRPMRSPHDLIGED